MTPARTIVFGSGAFAVPVLERLTALPEVEVVAVVTRRPAAAGRSGRQRPTPLAGRARDLGLPVLELADLGSAAVARLVDLHAEFGVLADFGFIVPPAVIDLLRHGILNVHPSLLPRHRGASPVAAAILAGDSETGVTVIRLDAGLDSGPVVGQRRLPLAGDERAPDLERRAAVAGAELLADLVPDWLAGRLEARAQPTVGVTRTRVLRRADGRLDPRRPAIELERAVRAYDPWPGTFLDTPDGRLIVHRAEVAAPGSDAPGEAAAGAPGTLVADGPGVALVTPTGRLRLLEVQPAGGRRMTGDAFRRGRPRLVRAAVVA